jgi:hypothetical protein
MAGRLARDDEIESWRDDGWVLLDGLVDPAEIDRAAADLATVFPAPADYHADPDRVRAEWLGTPAPPRDAFVWPPDGPGFRPEQHRWQGPFPFPGSGALNRLCVHPAIVDFVERALGTTDLRLYQAQTTAKYTGDANYEQPMHADRNHSWLPLRMVAPWWHVESFLYLSDVGPGRAPTHLVSVRDSVGRSSTEPLIMPAQDPELYAAERPATGPRGSLLGYRSDVFHRAVDHELQSKANSLDWVACAESLTPRELELFGFPPPGHPIWDGELLDATARRYPRLDLKPWRAALGLP